MNNYELNKSRNYGYSVVAASWLAVFCLFGYRATFAILKDPMSQEMGWSQSEVTLGYSVMMLFYAVTAFFSGLILDKWGTKPVYAIAAILGSAGFLLTSMADSYLLYLLSFGVIAGTATGMLWVTATVSVRKWFAGKKYATMWGIAFAGGPVAQWVLSEVTKISLAGNNSDAWRGAMVILAVIIFVFLLAAVFLSKNNPDKYKLNFTKYKTREKIERQVSDAWTIKKAYKTFAIWGAILTFLTSMMGEFLIWTQVVSYWTADLGFDKGTAINVYKTIGICGIFTMPLLGIVADKIALRSKDEIAGRKKMLVAGPFIGITACMILLLSGYSIFAAYLAAAVFAIYWAIVPGGVVGYTGAIYGVNSLGKIWGLATLIVMGIGPFTGSFIGGLMKDISGSYTYSIYFAIVSFLLSMVFAVFLPMSVKSKYTTS